MWNKSARKFRPEAVVGWNGKLVPSILAGAPTSLIDAVDSIDSLKASQRGFHQKPGAEVTIMINPATMDQAKAQHLPRYWNQPFQCRCSNV